MAHAAIESGNNVLTIEELSHEQLKSLAAAMYGKSLRDMFSFFDTPALTRFAHKYNISMEQAIQHFVPTKLTESQTKAMLQLYSSVPGEFVNLQDHILNCILMNYRKVEKAEESLAAIILPRHLNLLLGHLNDQPDKMLTVVTNIVQKEQLLETMLGIALRIPTMITSYGYNHIGSHAIDHDRDSWVRVVRLAHAALCRLRCKTQAPNLLDCPFYVGLLHATEIIKYQGHITKLEKDVKVTEMVLRDMETSLAKAQITLQEKDLEIQKLTEQQPRKQAKRS